MKVNRTVLISTMVLLIVAYAGASFAWQPRKVKKWWRMPRVVKELSLTPVEQKRLDELHLQMQQKRLQYRSQKQQAQLMVDNQFGRDQMDPKAVNQAFQKLAEAQAGRSMEQSRFFFEVRKLLGRERFARLKEIFREFKKNLPRRPRRGGE